jgi:hypothetical protein
VAKSYRQQAKQYEIRTLEYLKNAGNGAAKANVKIGLMVSKEAKKNVPVRTGNLRASGFVVTDFGVHEEGGGFLGDDAPKDANRHAQTISETRGKIAVLSNAVKRIGAVGFSAIYALSVHENPNAGAAGANTQQEDPVYKRGARKGRKLPVQYVHSKVGGWKFLQRAFETTRPRLPQIYQSESRKEVRAKMKPLPKPK